jgi:RimJ/RimL family protein N-acetyltransferase
MTIGDIQTPRLAIGELTAHYAGFIHELLNTPEWIRFIGDRQVKSIDDANQYIDKIRRNPAIHYWVLELKEESVPIGIVSVVKRDYLAHPDLGFALLPRYGKRGYAHEATSAVLQEMGKQPSRPLVLATVLEENHHSIHLLTKLGFRYDQPMVVGAEKLLIYSYSVARAEH